MKTVYNYKKIQKRIDELQAMRDENEHFIGSWEELNELMDLDGYNRQTFAHALCLDFKTNVTYVENWFTYKPGHKMKTRTIFLVVDGNPYTAELEQIETEKHKAFNYDEILVLKPMYSDQKERKFLVQCRDISCCDCYFIKEEITDKVAA